MSNKEQAVRDAAAKLMQAIKEARAEGLVVTWPAHAEGLESIAISTGRRAMTPDEIGAAAKAQAERERAPLPRTSPLPPAAQGESSVRNAPAPRAGTAKSTAE